MTIEGTTTRAWGIFDPRNVDVWWKWRWSLRVLGKGSAVVRLNGVTLAAGASLSADAFAALDVDPRCFAAGANLLEIEPRGPGAAERAEVLLVERPLP